MEDSHIWASRVVPVGSHRRRLVERSRAPHTLQHRGGRVGRDRDFNGESDVVFVNKVKTITQEDTKAQANTYVEA